MFIFFKKKIKSFSKFYLRRKTAQYAAPRISQEREIQGLSLLLMRRSSTELAHSGSLLYVSCVYIIYIYIDVSTDNVCLSVLFTLVRKRRAVCVCRPTRRMRESYLYVLPTTHHHVYT